jgi:dolichyl-phosphate beta-glucosyltransferase
MPALTVVIPAFNEAQRIGATLHRISEYLAASRIEADIVVVDDGSADGTAAAAAAFGGPARVRTIRLPANRGKGYAVRQGLQQAPGVYVLITDADLSTPIDQIGALFEALQAGVDIAIASRGLPESDIVIHQPWWREHMGRIFNLCARGLGLTSFSDTQCGFKLLRSADARRLCPLLVIDGFAFDVELLFAAAQAGLRAKEIPVVWRHAELSRVDPVPASAAMIRDLLRVRVRAWCGRYGRRPPDEPERKP